MSARNVTIVVEPSGRGGAEFYVCSLAAHLRKHFPLTVALPVSPLSGPLREMLDSAGITYEDLRQVPYRYLRNFRDALTYFNERRDRFFRFSLNHPDSCRWSLLAASLLNIDYVITEHLVPPDPFRQSLYFAVTHVLFHPLKTLAYRRANRVIAVSNASREILVNNYGMPAHKITVIHNGIDAALWAKDVAASEDIHRELGLTPDDVVLSCVARLDLEKGHVFLIQCLPALVREFPSLRLVLVGDGPLRRDLEELTESLGLSRFVRFTGHRGDIPRLMKLTDIFVLPSLNEGFPFTILEAMASSIPVIATRVAGVPEAVTDGQTGFIVPPGEPAELGKALGRLLGDTALRKSMGQHAFQRVSDLFSRQDMLDRTVGLYPSPDPQEVITARNKTWSVVICTHNRAQRLRETLASVARLDIPSEDFEILVIDNASQDDTMSVVENAASRSANLKYVKVEQLGLSHARNTGIEHARGEFIAFLDDDALPEPDWLDRLGACFKDPRVVCVGGMVRPLWEKRDGWPDWLHPRLTGYFTVMEYRGFRQLGYPSCPAGTNIAFRRTVFDEVGTFNTQLGRIGTSLLSGEEADLCIAIEKAGHRIVYTPEAVVHHRVHEDRLTQDWLRQRSHWGGVSSAITERRRFGTVDHLQKTVKYILLTAVSKLLKRVCMLLNERREAFFWECQDLFSRAFLKHLWTQYPREENRRVL